MQPKEPDSDDTVEDSETPDYSCLAFFFFNTFAPPFPIPTSGNLTVN